MALIVETGAGIPNANSYASESALVSYAAARGVALTVATAEPLLVAAMDRLAGLPYIGTRVARDQALDWPRSDVCVDGFEYESTELPPQLAQAQMAYAMASRSAALMPVVAADAPGTLIERTVGPITRRFSPGYRGSKASVPLADSLLAKLLRAGSGNSFRIQRA